MYGNLVQSERNWGGTAVATYRPQAAFEALPGAF